jgi:Ribbon-helix-helix protein, copG family
MDDELGRKAASRGVSKSDLVREAIAEYLVESDAPAPGSFLAAAADLAGCLDGGPDDLSYNPEHLADYGK